MKKLTALLLGFTMLLTLAACGGGEKDGATDAVYNREFLHGANVGPKACATGEAVYYVPYGGKLIYYIDKSTGTGGPLCGKAECEHNDSNCNAYVNRLFGMSIYEGRLCWIDSASNSDLKIYSAALDGTDRREICGIDKDFFPSTTTNAYMTVYQGYAYLSCKNQSLSDGEFLANFYVCAFPLEPEEEPFVLLNGDTLLSGGTYSNIAIQPYKDALYIVTTEPFGNSIDEFENDHRLDLTIMRWDIIARELETLYIGEGMPYDLSMEMWVEDDGIMFYTDVYNEDGSYKDRGLYQYRFDNGEIRLLFHLPNGFVNISMANDLVITGCEVNNEEWSVLIQDYEGNTLVEETYTWASFSFPDWVELGYNAPWCFGADEENAYFSVSYSALKEGTYFVDYMDYVVFTVALDGSGVRLVLDEKEYGGND